MVHQHTAGVYNGAPTPVDEIPYEEGAVDEPSENEDNEDDEDKVIHIVETAATADSPIHDLTKENETEEEPNNEPTEGFSNADAAEADENETDESGDPIAASETQSGDSDTQPSELHKEETKSIRTNIRR